MPWPGVMRAGGNSAETSGGVERPVVTLKSREAVSFCGKEVVATLWPRKESSACCITAASGSKKLG